MSSQPSRIEPYNSTEILIAFNTGEQYAIPYIDLRFHCPCAGCVDEHTGERTILRSSIAPDIRPTGVSLVGRYAVQITWSDLHATGMYHFDQLHDLAKKVGRKITS